MDKGILKEKPCAGNLHTRLDDVYSEPEEARRRLLCCKYSLALIVSFFSAVVFGSDIATSVTARQIQPWNGLIEIVVGLDCESNELNVIGCSFAATNSATLAALPVTKVRQVGSDTGSGTSWTRYFIWDAAADLGEVKIDDVALTVDAKLLGGVQLWENGPYWATCNVGASKPEEYGYYFWWGDTVGYKLNAAGDGWVSVQDGTSFSFDSSSCPTDGMNNPQLQSAGYIDASGNLVAAHDAATAHLGAPWRMPTSAEIDELISNCTTEWTTRNGVYGRLISGKGAYVSKSIFLPAAGYGYGSALYGLGSDGDYWSSAPSSGNSRNAWYLDFYSGNFRRDGSGLRYFGQPVRSLRGFAK